MTKPFLAFFDDPENQPVWPSPEEAAARISISAMRRARIKAASRMEKALRRAYRQKIGKGDQTATVQTTARHMKSSFIRMIERKEVTGAMLQAAEEIDRVYMALTGMMMAGGGSMEPRSPGHAPSMPESVATAHSKRYLPWARKMAVWRDRGGPAALEIVIDVVIDGRPLALIDRERRWRNGTAKSVVRLALMKYAVLAQWAPASDLGRHMDLRKAA